MPESFYFVIISVLWGLTVSLLVYAWAQQNKRISDLENVTSDYVEMKTNIKWIKRALEENKII